MSRRALGKEGEDSACRYLEKKGYHTVSRNYTVRGGEIDIIAVSPCGRNIVFIEVKTRTGIVNGSAGEAVNDKKLKHLCQAAERYLYENSGRDISQMNPRFDVIEVYINEDKNMQKTQNIALNHIKNIDIN